MKKFCPIQTFFCSIITFFCTIKTFFVQSKLSSVQSKLVFDQSKLSFVTSKLFSLQCVQKSNIQWQPVHNCLITAEGDKLLAQYGDVFDSAVPKITYVPRIVFNGTYNETVQNKAEGNFLKTTCELLNNIPDGCLKKKQ